MRSGIKVLIGAFLVFAVGAIVAALVRGFRVSSDPEAIIAAQLKATESKGLRLSIPHAPWALESTRHRFDRISVTADLVEGKAVAFGTLDFVGTLGPIQISSLGSERIPFRYRAGTWEPETSMAPLLSAAVKALVQRQRALEAGDASGLAKVWAGTAEGMSFSPEPALRQYLELRQRSYQVDRWSLRLEREKAIVTEVYKVVGHLPSRPVEERGRRQLTLVWRGGAFLFWPTLM